MTDENRPDTYTPPIGFYFLVYIAGLGEIVFKDVSGLHIEEASADISPRLQIAHLPDPRIKRDVILKEGFFENGTRLMEYFQNARLNVTERQPTEVRLFSAEEELISVWELTNAWPRHLVASEINADEDGVVIETLILDNEGISLREME